MKHPKVCLLLITIFLGVSTSGVSATLDQAVVGIQKDIESATQALAKLREEISKERTDLSESLEKQQDEVVRLRQEYQHLNALTFRADKSFVQLKEDIAQSEENVRFTVSLLTEHFREMRKRMAPGEEAAYQEEIADLSNLLHQSDAEIVKKLNDFLSLAHERNTRAVGGYTCKGDALNQQGTLHSGTWLFLGSLSYFFSETGNVSGFMGISGDHIKPAVVYESPLEEIKKIVDGQSGVIPVDVTLGGALKMKRTKKSWMDDLKAGGFIIIPILLLGAFCILGAVWKFLLLRAIKVPEQHVIDEIVDLVTKGEKEEAFRRAEALGIPFSPVLKEGIEHSMVEKEHLEEIMHERILFQIPYLEKGLSLLAVGAAASPLLGLLGTVTGMMHTFNLVTIFGTGKTDLLSGGIFEALITTKYGLIVAIPALLAHAFLSRRVKVIIHMLEQKSVAYINRLFSQKKQKATLT
jgi:biopolymer transport protein ExbB